MHDVLLGILALDCVQLVVALAALVRSGRSSRAGAPSHARYSLEHGALLIAGAIVLLVPVVLGLAGAIAESSAVYAAVAVEVVVLPVARLLLRRSEAAHLARRPA